jgi:hypothetical protein
MQAQLLHAATMAKMARNSLPVALRLVSRTDPFLNFFQQAMQQKHD